MKNAVLILTLAAALSAVTASAHASPARALNPAKRQAQGGVSQGGVSQGADLQMTQIQSLVSQRQAAVQMTSQMLNGANGCPKCITQNIGQ